MNVFVDMDGVIFVYEKDHYEGENPKYKQKNYFANRPVDENAIRVLKSFCESDDIANVYILSSAVMVYGSKDDNERVANEKRDSIRTHIPWFPEDHVIITTEHSKVETVRKFLGRDLARDDVMLDDYNKNLIEWEENGGTAIKYVNGINSESEMFPNICGDMMTNVPRDEEYLYRPICDTFKTDDEKAYDEALADFNKRLIMVELSNEKFTKYTQTMNGITCTLGIINEETQTITPLPDDFNSPYDKMKLWEIAVTNSAKRSSINDEMSNIEENMYNISTPCLSAIINVDAFWNSVCQKLGCIRLIVHVYHESSGVVIFVSKIANTETTPIKVYLSKANEENENRCSYVYVRDVGMLSEKALNQ